MKIVKEAKGNYLTVNLVGRSVNFGPNEIHEIREDEISNEVKKHVEKGRLLISDKKKESPKSPPKPKEPKGGDKKSDNKDKEV